MTGKEIGLGIAAVLLGSFLVATTGYAAESVRDDLGREHPLQPQPQRLISLAPSITETVFALGAGTRLVGVSSHCDHPKEALAKPRIGGFASPDQERILSLRPDAVLVTRVTQERVRLALEHVMINVYTMYPERIEDLPDSIRRLGTFLGNSTQADSLARITASKIEAVRSEAVRRSRGKRVRVFFEIDPNPLMTVTDQSFEGSLISLAGGENIAAGLPRAYTRIAPEVVVQRDPQVIVMTHQRENLAPLNARRGWQAIAAVRNHRVHVSVDPDLLVRPGPRSPDGARALLALFFPLGDSAKKR